MKVLIPLVALGMAACASCRQEVPEPGPSVPNVLLVPVGSDPGIVAGSGGETVVRVEIASDVESRHRGLMERPGLPPDSGMLFVYPSERPLEFWMKNTRIPLSIAFLDRAGQILRILEMEPDPGGADEMLPRYRSERAALYALEMERGWFREHGIAVGDRVRLHPDILSIRAR